MRRGDRQNVALVAILLLAAGLRTAACFHWSDDLTRDPDAYAAYAERWATTAGFLSPDGQPTAFRPPLYPLMLVPIERMAAPWGVAVMHVALGIATVVLTASLGRRLGLGNWSLLAALVVACDPLLLRYTPQVMTEVTCAFLAVCVLWLAAERRSFSLGIAFGLAVLARPTFWAFGTLVAIVWARNLFVAWRTRTSLPTLRADERNDISPQRQQGAHVRSTVLILAGVALVVMPWAVRNAVVLGRPILTTTHGGYTLLLANNPVFWNEVVNGPPDATWSGESLAAWQQSLEVDMAKDGITPDDELARDRWMKDRAITNIREQPGMFLQSIVYRTLRLWDVAPMSSTLPRPIRWSVTAFYIAVFGLAIAGLIRTIASTGWTNLLFGPPLHWGEGSGVRGVHRRTSALATDPMNASNEGQPISGQPQTASLTPGPSSPGEGGRGEGAVWYPVLLLILAFTTVHAVYWTDTRMRAPLVPAVALLAARAFVNEPDRRSS